MIEKRRVKGTDDEELLREAVRRVLGNNNEDIAPPWSWAIPVGNVEELREAARISQLIYEEEKRLRMRRDGFFRLVSFRGWRLSLRRE